MISKIAFSEEELIHLSKDDIKTLYKIKRYAKNLVSSELNMYCPECGHRMMVSISYLSSRKYYCECCGYYERNH